LSYASMLQFMPNIFIHGVLVKKVLQ